MRHFTRPHSLMYGQFFHKRFSLFLSSFPRHLSLPVISCVHLECVLHPLDANHHAPVALLHLPPPHLFHHLQPQPLKNSCYLGYCTPCRRLPLGLVSSNRPFIDFSTSCELICLHTSKLKHTCTCNGEILIRPPSFLLLLLSVLSIIQASLMAA